MTRTPMVRRLTPNAVAHAPDVLVPKQRPVRESIRADNEDSLESVSKSNLNLALPARIAMLIEREILAGRFKPGQWLREVELSETLEVSRTPLREAFHVLSRKGLLEILPRRGVRVRSVTAQEMDWFLTIRASLDGLAARLASIHISSAALAELQLLIDEQRATITAGRNEKFAELGGRFHELIYEATGNQKLLHLYRTMAIEGALYRMHDLSRPGSMQKSLAEHRQLLSAIRRRDPDHARMLAEKHMERVLGQFQRK